MAKAGGRGINDDKTLKKGLMYIEVPEYLWASFDAWLAANRGNVKTKVTNRSGDEEGERIQFVKFQVLQDGITPWEGPGYPTLSDTATPDAKEIGTDSSAWIEDDEEEEDDGDILTTKGKIITVGVAVVAVGLFIVKKIYVDPWIRMGNLRRMTF